jgi:alkylation response protein AidB-like acyl-CoA dehydrogenase
LPVANFFLDNEDIQFLFEHIDLAEIGRIQEDDFADAAGRRPLRLRARRRGRRDRQLSPGARDRRRHRRRHDRPAAEQIDREGNTLNDDGTVTLHPLVEENLDRSTQADLMGFTLPRKYGGLNCPNLIYTMATEMVSRADASLMNMFGLQGIAETINAFANDEIKDESCRASPAAR